MRPVLLLLFLLSLLPTANEAWSQEVAHKHIRIVKPWVHETNQWRVQLNITIANTGDRADRLLRVATAVAKRVVISDQEGEEGAGLTIPGGAEFIITGTIPRIELVGLKKPLQAQERFDLLLVFAQAGKVRVDAIVERDQTRRKPTAAARHRRSRG